MFGSMILAAVAVALSVVSGAPEPSAQGAIVQGSAPPYGSYDCVFAWPSEIADERTEWYVAVLAIPKAEPEWAFVLRQEPNDGRITVVLQSAARRIASPGIGVIDCSAAREKAAIRRSEVASPSCAALAPLARDLQSLTIESVPDRGGALPPTRYIIRAGTRDGEVVAWDDATTNGVDVHVLARWAELVRAAVEDCAGD
jgi:hypothetical protein